MLGSREGNIQAWPNNNQYDFEVVQGGPWHGERLLVAWWLQSCSEVCAGSYDVYDQQVAI